jgi:hypothetical protein
MKSGLSATLSIFELRLFQFLACNLRQAKATAVGTRLAIRWCMKTRIEQLRQKIREATGEDPKFGTSPDCPPEVEVAFLESVLAFETSRKRTLFELLEESGIGLPSPENLAGSELTGRLWEVIHALGSHSVILCNTDHLSDRELYALLWKETLRNHCVASPQHVIRLDMTENGRDDGMAMYLKYYASDGQRQMYADVYPKFKMPPHVDPPRRRDHLIPDAPRRLRKQHAK